MSKKENHQILLPENVKVIEPVEELYPIKLTLFCLATSCITLPFYLRFLRKLSKLYQSVDTGKTLSYSSIEGASVLIFFLGVFLLMILVFHYLFTYDKKPKHQQNIDKVFGVLASLLTLLFSFSYVTDKASLGYIGSGVLFGSFIMLVTIIYKNILEVSIIAFNNFVELEKGKQLTIALSLITFMMGLLTGK